MTELDWFTGFTNAMLIQSAVVLIIAILTVP
jgi:hypothetical protein